MIALRTNASTETGVLNLAKEIDAKLLRLFVNKLVVRLIVGVVASRVPVVAFLGGADEMILWVSSTLHCRPSSFPDALQTHKLQDVSSRYNVPG